MRHRLGWAVLLGLVLNLAAAATPGSAATKAAPTCEGPVVHTVDAAQPGSLPSLCVAVGGVVRLINIGPGSVTAQPSTAADCLYAAGTYQCRLLRTGQVVLILAPNRTLAVQVPAAVPGRPSTACAPAGAVVDLDTNDEMRWWAPCVRLGATLRVVNLGPGLLSYSPATALTCHYEGGVHACQFRRPATVTLTSTIDETTRTVTAVGVR